MTAPPTVLLIGDLAHSNAEWEALSSKYTLLEFRKGTREQFLENCRNGTYADVRGCYRSNQSTSITGPFNRELVDSLPESWKFGSADTQFQEPMIVSSSNSTPRRLR